MSLHRPWLLAVSAVLSLALSACGSLPGHGDGDRASAGKPGYVPKEQLIPNGGRVGILSLVDNHIIHANTGNGGLSDYRHEYPAQFDFANFAVNGVRTMLVTKTPYQAVLIPPTGKLLAMRGTWQKEWNEGRFGGDLQRHLDSVINQNRLKMLIIISSAETSNGVYGSGLYTHGGLFGSNKALAFSNVQFYRVLSEPARLLSPVEVAETSDTAGIPTFSLPSKLDELSNNQLAPVIGPIKAIIQRRIDALRSLLF